MKRTVFLLLASILLVSCGGGRHPNLLPSSPAAISTEKTVVTKQEISLDKVLAELEALPTPTGVDGSLFARLKLALREILLTKGVFKVTAKPPSAGVSDLAITDTGEFNYILSWSYVNPGDYNQDGIVDIKDITPLAIHFNEEVDQTNAWIDGNDDGAITIADITPLAANFFNEVAGYSIQGKVDRWIGELVEVSKVDFSTALENGWKSWQIDLPNSESEDYYFFAVVAFDSMGELGGISNLVGVPNSLPHAELAGDPLEGTLPLTVNFDASGSFDPDGTIVKYQWDFDGNATWDDESTEATIVHIYSELGEFQATVRVTDNRSAYANAPFVIINVNNLPPVAELSADPVSGSAPLIVNFDASASSDSDGEIVRYDYDWEGDGTYNALDAGSTISYTYTAVGEYQATVRVIDNDGGAAIAQVDISVNNWPPVAELSADPMEGELPLTVSFDASGSSDQDGTIVQYEWDWEGDGEYDDSTPQPLNNYTYSVFGTYDATVQVTDDAGATSIASVPITVPGWAHSWGGEFNEEVTAIAVTIGGDLYAAGYTRSFGIGGSSDIILLKYDSDGNLLWQKTWGGSGDDFGYAVAADDSSGSVYVVGFTFSFGVSVDAVILKYDSVGNLLWQKTWGGNSIDAFLDIGIDASGSVYAAGYTKSFGAGGTDSLLVRYNSNGYLLRQRVWGGSGDDAVYAVAVTAGGSTQVYTAGKSNSFGAGGDDAILLRYDSNGGLLWQKNWGGIGDESISALSIDIDKNIWAAGNTTSFGANGSDIFLLEVSPATEILQEISWGGGLDDEVSGLAVDTLGNMYLTGYTKSFGSGGTELLLLNYNVLDGTFSRQKTWGSTATDEQGWSVDIGSDGSIYLAGFALSNLGEGRNIEGIVGFPTGSVSGPAGDTSTPSGTETVPAGIETTPTGVQDTGGGSKDALIIQYGLLPE